MHNISSASFSLRNFKSQSDSVFKAHITVCGEFISSVFNPIVYLGNIKSVLRLPVDYLDRVRFCIKELGVGSSTLNNDVTYC